ncbi:MAG: DHH family phosphoesterase [Spirochaetota bacterium]
MIKRPIKNIAQKNKIITNILEAMKKGEHFLIIGHQNPDEDCIASMVAFSLLLNKFFKDTRIYLGTGVHEHFQYLMNICRYNDIGVVYRSSDIPRSVDTVVVCDTAKLSMVYSPGVVKQLQRRGALILEIDHHVGSDSTYIGDPDHCLITEATSTCELITRIVLKLRKRRDMLEYYEIEDPFTRNIILALLTGMIGDTNMGRYLKSRREKRSYRLYTNLLNNLLAEKTTKGTNFSNKEEVFSELQRLSREEENCFGYFMDRKKFSNSIGYVIMSGDEMDYLGGHFSSDTIVSVSRYVANTLAEESRKLSLVVYYDSPVSSDLIQFRMRRSHAYRGFDLRRVLKLFSITNGGGHEGAIGFRIPRNQVPDIHGYVTMLLDGIEKAIAG